MSQDKEREIKLLFLDEAQEYLDTLDSAVLGLSGEAQSGGGQVDIQKINAALRAAHSIKGGAGMMGYTLLSQLSHRLEDSFKVLKIQHQSIAIDAELENLLLKAVDALRVVIRSDRQQQPVDLQWKYAKVEPVFNQLHNRLGDPQEEDATSVLATESGQMDLVPILFESEVEGCLQRLEGLLAEPDQSSLTAEMETLAQELGGLGEMLGLADFCQLCESVTAALAAAPEQASAIAQSALQAWRHTQALVLSGQMEQLPTAIAGAGDFTGDFAGAAIVSDSAFDTLPLDLGEFTQPPEAISLYDFETADVEHVENTEISEGAAIAAVSAGDLAWDMVADDNFLDLMQAEVSEAVIGRAIAPPMAKTSFTPIPVETAAAAEVSEETGTVRVAVRQLNQLNDLAAELTIDRNGLETYLKRLRNLSRSLIQRVRLLDQSNYELRTAYDRVTLGNMGNLGLSMAPGGAFQALAGGMSDSVALSSFAALAKGGGNGTGDKFDNGFNNKSDDGFVNGFASQQFDSLEMDQYNDLHLLSQQMMETIVQIQEITTDIDLSLDDADQTSRSLSKTSKQFQTQLNQVRMRPLTDVVDRFPRALRELCLEHNKQAQLNVIGGATLVERTILEALGDPLMHLFRNAFDHGLETPENRLAQGKPETGLIEIRAMHQGNRTLITIRDDGNGIPLDKVRAKALQMGLDEELLEHASEQELLSLIFEPGFSTSDRVTDLSGRGVGMDVVRDSLQQIKGDITVETKAGQGTTFTLSVPYTLSVVNIHLVESNGMLMALPSDGIADTVVLQPGIQVTMPEGAGITWNHQTVPLLNPANWMQFNCPRPPHALETEPTIDTTAVVIMHQGDRPVGLVIDRAWGEHEVALRRIEGGLGLPEGFTSCAIVGNGRVVPLVDLTALMRLSGPQMAAPSMPGLSMGDAALTMPSTPADLLRMIAEAGTPPVPTILIIDDSINVRRFLALSLEKGGFRVEQAKDGQDALEKLQQGLTVQAIICDIEMPRLDGYGFLTQVKSMPAFAHLPVAMLTSRSGDKHRQLAMNLGAVDYFSKPYNEQDLLQAVNQMVQAGVTA